MSLWLGHNLKRSGAVPSYPTDLLCDLGQITYGSTSLFLFFYPLSICSADFYERDFVFAQMNNYPTFMLMN